MCKYIYINSLHLDPASPPLIPPVQVITEHQAGLPMLHNNFPPSIYFTHDSVYMSMLLSSFIPLSPSLTVSTSPFSTPASPFLPCR